MEHEKILEIKKRYKIYKIVSICLAFEPIIFLILAMVLKLNLMGGKAEIFSILRNVFIVISFIDVAVVIFLNKYFLNIDRFLEMFKTKEGVKKFSRKLINNPVYKGNKMIEELKLWLDDSENREIPECVRLELFLSKFISSKLAVSAISLSPSIFGFVLVNLNYGAMPVFAGLICLSYVVFYKSFVSEYEFLSYIQKLEQISRKI